MVEPRLSDLEIATIQERWRPGDEVQPLAPLGPTGPYQGTVHGHVCFSAGGIYSFAPLWRQAQDIVAVLEKDRLTGMEERFFQLLDSKRT